jgi:benzoyl-CoA reductase/2-hydroxyglutaryl-CoA dehydratase subunit BcrC/BadD/HgdB
MPLLDAIERAGGRVVLNATEAGERSLWPASPLGQAQPDDEAPARFARGYLANCVDVYQRPNTRLYDWLRPRLSARRVRGIVLWHYVACDLWRAEAQPMREAFGLPVLLLDADEAAPKRSTGRLEAFLESLQ